MKKVGLAALYYRTSEDCLILFFADLNSNASPYSQGLRVAHSTSEGLKIAIDLGDLELCKRLSESGTNLASRFGWCMGCTSLLYSLHKKQIAIAEYLVSQGVPTAGRTCKAWATAGFTPFHYAAVWNSIELLRLLLGKSPEIYVDHHSIHPIHLAVLKSNAECVKLILDHNSHGMKFSPCQIPSMIIRDTLRRGKKPVKSAYRVVGSSRSVAKHAGAGRQALLAGANSS